MKHKVLFLLAGILTILVVECNRTTPVSPNQTITLTPGPGAFGLGYMKGLSKSTANAAVKSGANVNFDLGSIKGSTAFYFLLYNIGSTPITNVTLSIADTPFAVYPSAMDTLIPGGDVGAADCESKCLPWDAIRWNRVSSTHEKRFKYRHSPHQWHHQDVERERYYHHLISNIERFRRWLWILNYLAVPGR